MTDPDEAARLLILARLAESRQELRRVLDPPRQEADGSGSGFSARGGFPRSRTMQMLLSSRGLGAVGALLAGLLIARPALVGEQELQAFARNRRAAAAAKHLEKGHAAFRPNSLLKMPLFSLGTIIGTISPRSRRAASK